MTAYRNPQPPETADAVEAPLDCSSVLFLHLDIDTSEEKLWGCQLSSTQMSTLGFAGCMQPSPTPGDWQLFWQSQLFTDISTLATRDADELADQESLH